MAAHSAKTAPGLLHCSRSSRPRAPQRILSFLFSHNRDSKLFCTDQHLPPALGTKKRKIFQHGFRQQLEPCFAPAKRAKHPFHPFFFILHASHSSSPESIALSCFTDNRPFKAFVLKPLFCIICFIIMYRDSAVNMQKQRKLNGSSHLSSLCYLFSLSHLYPGLIQRNDIDDRFFIRMYGLDCRYGLDYLVLLEKYGSEKEDQA